jgi:CRP-like cAMP-binding protein
MTASDLVDRLAAHKTLGAAPRQELEWLASHGSLRQLDTGELLGSKGASVDRLFVVLSGRLAIFVEGAGLHKIMEWRAGTSRAAAVSRLVSGPGDTIARNRRI